MKKSKRRTLTQANTDLDPTAALRKHAVWMVPGVFLVHGLVIYGACPVLAHASLAAAVLALPAGLAVRWLRSVSTLLAIAIALIAFVFLYVMGIAAPLAFLSFAGHRSWIPVSVMSSSAALVALLYWRVRCSLRTEWSMPLDQTPGIELNMVELTLTRRPMPHQAKFTARLAVGMLVLLLPLMLFARDTLSQLTIFVVGPFCIALLAADFVARGITYWWAARRWELEHGIRFKIPSS